ncbi:MAG: NAD-dependent DNA ligase LigA, partial [Patescibacteria group bacterium]|nr:NAD-dependent DNA ligase LigA [Patescibacteria group bacterium]
MEKPKNLELKPKINVSAIQTERKAKSAIQKLRHAIRYHNYRYYIKNDPVISDSEYDKLLKTLQELEEKWPKLQSPTSPTKKVGGAPVNELETVRHPYPMLSLKATRKSDDIHNFDKTCRRELEKKKINYTAEPKYDGLAIEIIYKNGHLVRAATRGNGEQGDNVTENIKTVSEVPLRLIKNSNKEIPNNLVVHGEVYIR